MPHYRKRKNQKYYSAHTSNAKGKACQFCAINDESDQLVHMANHFKIIYNIFPYDFWDGRSVVDHLMLVPKEHSDTLSSLGKDAALEFVQLMSEYESRGYDVYARSPQSTIKSVPHQHTHLFKLAGKVQMGVVHLQKPYISIVW